MRVHVRSILKNAGTDFGWRSFSPRTLCAEMWQFACTLPMLGSP